MILRDDGYIAEVDYEEGDALMHGVVVNARAVLHFAGGDIAELKAAFADTIADYRDWRRERGVEPEKPLFRDAVAAHPAGAAPPDRRAGGEGGREHQPVHRRSVGRSRMSRWKRLKLTRALGHATEPKRDWKRCPWSPSAAH